MEKFDVIVIGTGSGASVAHKCAEAGKRTAIVDINSYGGTCALRGCDPKKVLVGLARVLALNQQFLGKGIISTPLASWNDLMQFKRSFTDPKPFKSESGLKKSGVITYHGRAIFITNNIIQVNENKLQADQFVIASGAKPVKLVIPGEELLIDSTEFLELKELPNEIIFVGGGYIAFEFAHIAVRFGVKVTIIHRGQWPLESFDNDLVKYLIKASQELGINIILTAEVKAIKKEKGHFIVQVEQSGKALAFSTSLVVHAAGRTADIENMGLEIANVSYNHNGVAVNDYMQSISNENVYACGDANDQGLPLTPVGGKEALILVSNLLKGNHTKVNYGHVPSNVFTIPPLAAVGFTEQMAKKNKLNYRVNLKDTTTWYTSRRFNEPVSAFKVLIDNKSGDILGAHLLGPNAEEVINIFAMAMNAGLKADELKKTIFSYPTSVSDIVYML